MSGKAVVQFRQRRKRWAVDAFGGKCGICGYDKCVEALATRLLRLCRSFSTRFQTLVGAERRMNMI